MTYQDGNTVLQHILVGTQFYDKPGSNGYKSMVKCMTFNIDL